MSKHKSDYLKTKNLTPADELRQLLTDLEQRHFKFKTMTSTQALILLRELDQIYHLFGEIEAKGLDLLPERGRFKLMAARIRKEAAALLKALGGATELAGHRPQPEPESEQWWWWIDRMVADRRKQRLAVVGLIGGVVLIVISALILLFNTVWAPSPEATIAFRVERNAEVEIEAGEYRAALAVIEQGLTELPTDATFWLYKGLLHQTLDEDAAAAQAFEQSQRYVEEPLYFYLARSQLSLRLDQPSQAELDARAAINLDENEGRAWLLLGQSLQTQGQPYEAVEAYERAADMAWESGDSELVVLARLALSQLSAAPVPEPEQ